MDKSKLKNDVVGLLSRVTITNLNNGKQMTYTITSSSEANLSEGKMSVYSPIAQALMGKRPGDSVSVKVPAGNLTLRVDCVEL